MPLSENVWNRLRADFEPPEHAEISEALEMYQDNERERVQLYILKLAGGSKKAIYELVDAANRDYRNIIFWAENPEEAHLDTPERRQEMREMFHWLGIATPDELEEPDQ